MTQTYTAKNPPPPLTSFKRKPAKFIENKVTLVVLALILAHIGMFMIVGGYYGLFEAWAPMTKLWHHVVSDSFTRHMIRDIGEGFLGGFLAQQIIWNHYKKPIKKPNLLDRAEIALHIPNLKCDKRLTVGQVVVSPVLAILYAAPGFLAALLLTKWLKQHPAHVHTAIQVHAHHAGNLWQRAQTIWTGSWDKKLIGYGASLFFGRRPMRKVFDGVQLWFAERRVRNGSGTAFYHSPTFRARYHAVEDGGCDPSGDDHSSIVTVLTLTGVTLGLALAGFGFYVLTYIAH